MSIVYAGIVPHSPVLIPSVGKEHQERAAKTLAALDVMEKELYARFPDTLLIVSPQGHIDLEHFTVDVNEKYLCNLREFGDFQTEIVCNPDMRLAYALRTELRHSGLPVMFRSEEVLDHGVTVPLYHLAGKMRDLRVIPVYPSNLDLKTHFRFGKALKETLVASDRRVGIIASVGLSHKLTESAPGGFDERGKLFDERMRQLLMSRNSSGLVNFDEELAKAAGENALRPLTILAGMLDKMQAEPEELSYESPFGVGFLVAHYLFS